MRNSGRPRPADFVLTRAGVAVLPVRANLLILRAFGALGWRSARRFVPAVGAASPGDAGGQPAWSRRLGLDCDA
jgi:hypothetical protein